MLTCLSLRAAKLGPFLGVAAMPHQVDVMPFLQPASYTDAALDENSWWAEATWCLDAEVGIVGLLFHLNFWRGIKLSMQHLGGETSNIF